MNRKQHVRFRRVIKEIKRHRKRIDNGEHDIRSPEQLRDRVKQLENWLTRYHENNEVSEEKLNAMMNAGYDLASINHG